MSADRDVRVAQAIRDLAARLADGGIDSAMRDARLIVAEAADIPMARLTLCHDDPLSDAQRQALDRMARARLERRPLSHILGRRAFFKHEFEVGPDVLDPRPETETLVLAALDQPFERVLDLGTGSGAILLSLLAEREGARGLGTDLSPQALSFARRNAVQLGLAARCEFALSDWFEQVEGEFNLIVSNPPYIAKDEMAGLAPELAFEPRMALSDGADGLSAYRVICAGARAHLARDGWLMVEIGSTQGADVAALMRAGGLCAVQVLTDLDGRDRVVIGRNSG